MIKATELKQGFKTYIVYFRERSKGACNYDHIHFVESQAVPTEALLQAHRLVPYQGCTYIACPAQGCVGSQISDFRVEEYSADKLAIQLTLVERLFCPKSPVPVLFDTRLHRIRSETRVM